MSQRFLETIVLAPVVPQFPQGMLQPVRW